MQKPHLRSIKNVTFPEIGSLVNCRVILSHDHLGYADDGSSASVYGGTLVRRIC